MMPGLARRSSPEQVYRRALQYFTVEEITEGFAAARGLALPSQLRHLLRAQGRNLHAESCGCCPAHLSRSGSSAGAPAGSGSGRRSWACWSWPP